MVGHIRFVQLPRDAIESVVFLALLGGDDGVSRDLVLGSDDGVRRVLYSLQSSSRLLRDAVSVRAFARRCLSSPSIMESMLLARRRVALHRFLRISGGYERAVVIFVEEIRRLQTMSIPLPLVAISCKLVGRLFTQISAYTEAEKLLKGALDIDKAVQGAETEAAANTLHLLSEMLRGCVSACQASRERRLHALRGIQYARECYQVRRAALPPADECASARSVAGVANALHLLGYHCAEYAHGTLAQPYFEQASTALSRSQALFRKVHDDNMIATTLQDLGLCYYYQHRYKEALELYTAACHRIIETLGPCHPDLAVPTFNMANIMCATDEYSVAVSLYRVAYSINLKALGAGHAWTNTAWSSLLEAIDVYKLMTTNSRFARASDQEIPQEMPLQGSPAGGADVASASLNSRTVIEGHAESTCTAGTATPHDFSVDELASAQFSIGQPHAGLAASEKGANEPHRRDEAPGQPLVLTATAIEQVLLQCLQKVGVIVTETLFIDPLEQDYANSDSEDDENEEAALHRCVEQELSLIQRELEHPCAAEG